jgi:general secretion pathway protein B
VSYILDALKKSEKERQRGTLPDMLTVQDIVAEKPGKRLWVYVLVVASILNAGALTGWLVFSHEKAKTGQRARAEIPSPVSLGDVGRAVSEPPGLPASPQRVTPEMSPVADNPPPAVDNSVMGNAETPHPDRNARPSSPAQDVPPHNPAPASNSMKSSDLTPVKPETAMKAAGLPTEPSRAVLEVPDEKRIYEFRELPLSVRQSLPPFSVSALMYASNPASRMVRVNEQMLHEGQDLAAGITLDEITRDGLIFRYQKYRFHVDVK